MTKTIENKIELVNELDTAIEKTLSDLEAKRDIWSKQELVATNTLYALLEASLEFYYFVTKSKSNEEAFKRVINKTKQGTKDIWKKTSTLMIIVKNVFGDNKKSYAYATALKKAIEAKIGTEGNISMWEFLAQNNGINGVIRKEREAKLKSNQHYFDIVDYFDDFGFEFVNKCKFDSELRQKQGDEDNEVLVHCKLNADGTYTVLHTFMNRLNSECGLLKRARLESGKALDKEQNGLVNRCMETVQKKKNALELEVACGTKSFTKKIDDIVGAAMH